MNNYIYEKNFKELLLDRYCSTICANNDPDIKKLQSENKKEYFKNLSAEDKENRSDILKEKWKERDVKSMVSSCKYTKNERYGDENYNNSIKRKNTLGNNDE